MYKRYAGKALAALLCAVAMQGCMKDGPADRGADEVVVRVEVDVKGSVNTRGMTEANENTVSTVDVFHFVEQPDGKFRAVSDAPAQGTFTAGPPSWINAKLHTYPGRNSRLVMLANARKAGNHGYVLNMELDAFVAGLIFEETGQWYNGTPRPLPMYAVTGNVEIKEDIPGGEIDNAGNPFSLIRMHAKFNVRLKSPLDSGTFELASVCAFNRKTQGYIAYDETKLDTTDPLNPKATAPYVPASAGNVYEPALPYYGVGTNSGNADYRMIVNKQYLFEVDNASVSDRLDKTALVIGGKYGSDTQVTYYRVDIDATGGNILRNRLYDVEIQSVDGRGYDTAEEAFVGSKKIEVKITDWALGGTVVTDPGGQRYLWLSDLEFEAAVDGETFTMTIDTNAAAWKTTVSGSDTDPNAGGASWLTVTPAIGGTGTRTLTITVPDNDELIDRDGYIHIQADGRLDAVVKVVQEGYVFDVTSTVPASVPRVGGSYTVTVDGHWPALQFRVVDAVTETPVGSISPSTLATGKGTDTSVTATINANSTWATRGVSVEYSTDGGTTWNTVRAGRGTQSSYYASISGCFYNNSALANNGQVAGVGGIVTVTITGDYPALYFRAAESTTTVSIATPTPLPAGTSASVNITIENNGMGAERTLTLQFASDATFTTDLTTFRTGIIQPKGNFALPSGRVVALNQLSYKIDWAQAMGIPSSYNNTNYPEHNVQNYTLDYDPANGGCAYYAEPGYPAGTWKLPTLDEMREMHNFQESIGNYTLDTYWTNAEWAPSPYHTISSVWVGGQGTATWGGRTGSYAARCVRNP